MCDGNEEAKEFLYRQRCVAEEPPLRSSVLITDSVSSLSSAQPRTDSCGPAASNRALT